MSMNLAFITVQGNHIIEFPYQTSTKISKKVMAESTVEDRMQIITDNIYSMINENDVDDQRWANNLLDTVENNLKDQTLELIMT